MVDVNYTWHGKGVCLCRQKTSPVWVIYNLDNNLFAIGRLMETTGEMLESSIARRFEQNPKKVLECFIKLINKKNNDITKHVKFLGYHSKSLSVSQKRMSIFTLEANAILSTLEFFEEHFNYFFKEN